jgi:glycosyltransferase involved in cell wall biosynthesis
VVVPNGFDEEAFANVEVGRASKPQRKLRLLHSGLLYPRERNPTDFFAAVAELKAEGALKAEDVEFAFRGSGNEGDYSERLARLQVDDLIKLLPGIPYAEALAEMNAADACMLFQASNCNQQIPAKVYEYLYCGKPILALTDPIGDTGQLLKDLNVSPVVPLDDKQKIKAALPAYVAALREGRVAIAARDRVNRYSRRSLTQELAQVLDQVSAARGPI